MIEEEYIRLIFGLKLKQIRTEKNLSLFGLAKMTGLSKSYLNEIEKGKKYPKRDKIVLLSEVLETTYDQLVSLKLDKNLAPIGEILQSRILKEIPLDIFGIKESDLIDIIAEAPVKVNAFISTLFEIAKHYNLTRESFFLAALRSYQEANNNYFEEIELQVEKFAKAYSLDLNKRLNSKDFEEILVEEYGYTIYLSNYGISVSDLAKIEKITEKTEKVEKPEKKAEFNSKDKIKDVFNNVSTKEATPSKAETIQSTCMYEVKLSNLNVRNEANGDAKILRILRSNDRFSIKQKNDNWILIDTIYKKKSGDVMNVSNDSNWVLITDNNVVAVDNSCN